jgi:hypothetical protein
LDILLTNALAHEFKRCEDAFALFTGLHSLVLNGSKERQIAIATYNSYTDFISHLYEFYLGCIKRDGRFSNKISGTDVDTIINSEVKKLLNLRRNRILRGEELPYENHIYIHQIVIPDDFGFMFRTVRNIRSHATAKRSEFDLADFYHKYHIFIYLLFTEPKWLWNIEKFPEHDWLAIEKFSKAILN